MTAVDTRDQLVGAMFDLVAGHGLDRLTVREVAARAGVSIGTVQHHFPTKDTMLVEAFEEVVRRTRARVAALRLGGDVRADVLAVLHQLLPLDAERAAETRVHLAFAARAAVDDGLGTVQAHTLGLVVEELAAVLAQRLHLPARDAARDARLLVAGVDGLALHAVSAPGSLSTRALTSAAAALVVSLLPRG